MQISGYKLVDLPNRNAFRRYKLAHLPNNIQT